MAKRSVVNRNKKRIALTLKFANKRKNLKNLYQTLKQEKIQMLV